MEMNWKPFLELDRICRGQGSSLSKCDLMGFDLKRGPFGIPEFASSGGQHIELVSDCISALSQAVTAYVIKAMHPLCSADLAAREASQFTHCALLYGLDLARDMPRQGLRVLDPRPSPQKVAGKRTDGVKIRSELNRSDMIACHVLAEQYLTHARESLTLPVMKVSSLRHASWLRTSEFLGSCMAMQCLPLWRTRAWRIAMRNVSQSPLTRVVYADMLGPFDDFSAIQADLSRFLKPSHMGPDSQEAWLSVLAISLLGAILSPASNELETWESLQAEVVGLTEQHLSARRLGRLKRQCAHLATRLSVAQWKKLSAFGHIFPGFLDREQGEETRVPMDTHYRLLGLHLKIADVLTRRLVTTSFGRSQTLPLRQQKDAKMSARATGRGTLRHLLPLIEPWQDPPRESLDEEQREAVVSMSPAFDLDSDQASGLSKRLQEALGLAEGASRRLVGRYAMQEIPLVPWGGDRKQASPYQLMEDLILEVSG